MSLLEDVFLEDEAGEAQELERVIEGDEFEERPRTPNSNENSEKEDEAEEDKRRVDHTAKAKQVVKKPRFVLNPARLTGPRGIQIIPEHFKDFKFKGKGHEQEDLDLILKKLEHWAYRLYPKFEFTDCLKKIETLGRKRPVMVHLHKIRTDQFMSEETVVQQDSSGDEAEAPAPPEEDEFDRLLQQQIDIARSTPAPGSVRKELHSPVANRSLLAPKATSSPSISDEQKERMIRNRKLAEERRLAKLKQSNYTVVGNTTAETVTQQKETTEITDKTDDVYDAIVNDKDDVHVVRKLNRSNVIDSSDEESDVMAVNESITVDVHNKVRNEETNSDKENIEEEEMTLEPEKLVNRTNNEVINENEYINDKDTVIEEASSSDQATLEVNIDSEVIEDESQEKETGLEHEPNGTDKATFLNDKITVDEDSKNTEEQTEDKKEQTKHSEEQMKGSVEQRKDSDNGEVSGTEDLMDVDFSDDF